MLTRYISGAMHCATDEILPDDGTFYGEIPGFQGVYANAATLEACRDELEEVLEDGSSFASPTTSRCRSKPGSAGTSGKNASSIHHPRLA